MTDSSKVPTIISGKSVQDLSHPSHWETRRENKHALPFLLGEAREMLPLTQGGSSHLDKRSRPSLTDRPRGQAEWMERTPHLKFPF